MTSYIHEQKLDQPGQASNVTEKPSESKEEDGAQFATGTRLLVIVIAILFAMFLVALV